MILHFLCTYSSYSRAMHVHTIAICVYIDPDIGDRSIRSASWKRVYFRTYVIFQSVAATSSSEWASSQPTRT